MSRWNLKQNWFLIGVLVLIILADIKPSFGAKGGPLIPEVTAKYIAVFVIFFISGVSLKTEDLVGAAYQFRLHLFIQGFTLCFIPLFMQVVIGVLDIFDLNEWIIKGLVTVSCMPPPVSSAVILTKAAGGNEAAAVFNSALGSVLGIVVTPLTLLYFLGFSTTVPLLDSILQLSLTVVFPLLVGQLFRHCARTRQCIRRIPFSVIGQSMLLFIIYTTFCDTFVSEDNFINAKDVLITVFLVVTLQVVLLWMTFTFAVNKKFSQGDTIAIIFCSTHKSLTLGIPMLRILFGGYAHLSYISLPLLVYHPVQILLGGLLVNHLQHWMKRRPGILFL